jgi:hypothetical protein
VGKFLLEGKITAVRVAVVTWFARLRVALAQQRKGMQHSRRLLIFGIKKKGSIKIKHKDRVVYYLKSTWYGWRRPRESLGTAKRDAEPGNDVVYFHQSGCALR